MKRESQYGAFSHLYIVPKVTVTLWYPETSTSLCHSIGKHSKNNPADQHTDSNPALTIVEDSHRQPSRKRTELYQACCCIPNIIQMSYSKPPHLKLLGIPVRNLLFIPISL